MIAGTDPLADAYYSPITHPDQRRRRAATTCSTACSRSTTSDRQQYQQAVNAPIVLGTYKEEAPRVGAYFSEEIRQYIERNEKFGVENLYQRGLKVYSTLDLRMQQAADVRAAHQRAPRIAVCPSALLMGLDSDLLRNDRSSASAASACSLPAASPAKIISGPVQSFDRPALQDGPLFKVRPRYRSKSGKSPAAGTNLVAPSKTRRKATTAIHADHERARSGISFFCNCI